MGDKPLLVLIGPTLNSVNALLVLSRRNVEEPIQGGPERMQYTPAITNFKEIRDYIKLVSAVMSRTLFFQQNDTKINDFDEGVLILETFF